MKQLLHSPLIEILQARVSFSRSTRLVTLEELSKNWGMTTMTLYRYASPVYRRISRDQARAVHLLGKKENRLICKICRDSLKGHKRCDICTILIHEKECIH